MSAARGSRLSDVGLGVRSAGAFRGGLAMLGIVVLVATTAISAWPRFADSLLTSDLQYRVAQAGAVNRDLVTTVTANSYSFYFGDQSAAGDTWRSMPQTLITARDSMKPSLRAVTAPGEFAARSTKLSLEPPADAAPNDSYGVSFEAFDGIRSAGVLDSGQWPAAASAALPSAQPLQIVMSTPVAERLQWKVGELRSVFGISDSADQKVLLTGTVHPRDPSSDFWQLDQLRARGVYADHGDQGKEYSAIAWVAPEAWTVLAPALGPVLTRTWFGMKPAAFTVDQLPQVQGSLGHFIANPITAQAGSTPIVLRFQTTLDAVLDDFLARAQPANTLFAILAAGPLGVALAVLVLGVRLIVGRRRDAIALMAARGASPWRVRRGLALEGAIVSIPAAALGLLAAILLIPRSGAVALPVTLAFVCAVAPPVVLALTAGALGSRDDVRAERSARRRWGWVVEVIVVALAALGVVALYQRGLTPPDAGLGVDPLLAITPILVALAACVLVLRIYPLPLAALAAVLRRRRGVVAFVGVTSSMRSKAGGLWPVFAVVVGVSITVFSVSVLSTERSGISEGARARVGADLSVTATSLTAAQIARIAAIPGVAHTATVEWAGGLTVTHAGHTDLVSGYLVDPAELAGVEAGVPPAARISAALWSADAGRVGAVVGGWNTEIPQTSAILAGANPIRLQVTQFDHKPGVYIWDAQWVFVDKSALPADAGISGTPSTVLVALAPDADSARVRASLASIGGDAATVGDAVGEAAALRAAPLVSGLEQVAFASILLSALMCIGALLLTLVMNAAARIRIVATLRTVGFSRRQTAGLIGWELGPIIAVGLVAGVIVGLVLPGVVLAPVDLSGFTGGPTRPPVVIDPVLVAAAAAGFVVVTLAATLIALGTVQRTSPATVLRAGGGE